MIRTFVLLGVGLALAATSASAQSRQSAIPRDELPPRGLCRVWLDDRPVWRQPAATDCATARRTAPPHSRIIHTEHSGRVTILPRIASNDRYYDRRADPRSPYYDARYDRMGLPAEAIGVLLVFDRILDMCRTAINVLADAACTVIVARLEGETGILPAPNGDIPRLLANGDAPR